MSEERKSAKKRRNPRREKVLAALIATDTQAAAAKLAGVDPKTVYFYLQDKDFAYEYQKAQRALVDIATVQAKKLLCPALIALQDILLNKDITATARVSAARTILEFGIRLAEINEIYERLEALEENFKQERK